MMHLLYYIWDIGEVPGIDLGIFVIRYYSLMWIAAFFLGYKTMEFMFKREHVDLKYLEPFFTYSIIGCMVGARLGHVIFYQPELFKEDFFSVFLPFSFKNGIHFTGFSGLASHGATIGFMISTYLFHRKYKELNLIWLFDRLVICIPIGGALIRMGNFMNSEIVGSPSSQSFAVLFPNQSIEYGDIVPRHPAQIYEAIGYIILFIILAIIYLKTDKKDYRGWFFGFFLVCLWTIRFIVEFYKAPQGDEDLANAIGIGLNNGQLLSIPFIILGFILMFTAKKNSQFKMKKLILGIACIGALFSCSQKSDSVDTDQNHLSYPFQKEGELTFYDDQGNVLQKIDLEIADNENDRQRGLMDRDSLAENQGMVFIFDKADKQNFWMKNTRFPLDLVYLSPDSTVVDIEHGEPYDMGGIPSDTLSQYVIELNKGMAEKWKIEIGKTKASWKTVQD